MITGVPRSGTTLLSNFINSCENAFCLSEPHHEFRGNGVFSVDKLHDVDCLPTYDETSALPLDRFVTDILDRRIGYDVGGFKETYRGIAFARDIQNQHTIEHYANTGYTVIGIVRDPVRVWNSQKTTKLTLHGSNPDPIKNFIQNWFGFMSVVPNPICYELFCLNPVAELERKTGIKISGKAELKPTKFAIGDGYAKMSASIRDHKLTDVTTAEEKLRLEPLRAMYRPLVLPAIMSSLLPDA
jgi:hypothetical protein